MSWGVSSRWWSPRPMRKTAPRWRTWPPPCKTRLARPWNWPSSIRATPVDNAAAAAHAHGLELAVVKLPEAKRDFVLLPKRWVVERDFAWAARFRRLASDYDRLAATLPGLHFLAFACLMLHRFTQLTLSP